MIRYLRNIFAIIALCTAAAVAQDSPQALLGKLEGKWVMEGTVRRKHVRYEADGSWQLHHQFLSFHMVDAATPSTYEVNLMIGVDTAKHEYVAHWLDSFGGAGARVAGTGPLSQQKIEIIYPYAEGRFRNEFQFDSSTSGWHLLIQAERADGSWSDFAEYTIVKK